VPDEWSEAPAAAALPPAPTAQPSDKVELANASEFVSWDQAPVVGGEESLDAPTDAFVVESSSAAELANDLRPSEASSVSGEKLELADNADFLQHQQLTQTGEAWTSDGRGIAIEEEPPLEGEIIQGIVVEEEAPAEPADSWGAAVAQPSPVPHAVVVPPLATPAPPSPLPPAAMRAAPPPPAPAPAVVPPLPSAPPLQVRVATPIAPPPAAPPLGASPVSPTSPGMPPPLGASPVPKTSPGMPPLGGSPVPPTSPGMPPPLGASPVPKTSPGMPPLGASPVPQTSPGMPPPLGASPVSPSSPGSPKPTGAALFDRSGAVLSGETAPVMVTGEHRVILHTLEGQVKRGAVRDADLCAPSLVLEQPGAAPETIARERVKALFFMLTPGSRPPAATGAKIRVTFKDGRQVAGFSSDHQSTQAGFFVVPADNRTNTERIFIYRHGIQSVVPE
jgi:hypothetical protein